MNTRNVRRVSQVVFLALFLVLIILTAFPPAFNGPRDLFLQFDPLIWLVSWVASRSVEPEMLLSIVILGLTVVLGRVFCGWICPMGTTLDLSDRLFFRKLRKKRDVFNPRNAKYYILAGVLVTALFTTQVAYLLDPISLLTRTVVLGFIAPIQMALRWVNDLGGLWSTSSFGPVSWIGNQMSNSLGARTFVANSQLYFRSGLLVLAVFIGIVSANSLSRRFWCRNLCPLGALLGLLGRVPVLKRVVGDACTSCTKCITDCKMGAIPEDPAMTRESECIYCFDCTRSCFKTAASFKFRPKPELHPETALDLNRRRVLQGAGMGFTVAALVKTDPARKLAIDGNSTAQLSSEFLIRPPGSQTEDQFVARCMRCGMCMKACPTNGLQPAFHEAGIEGFWTPVLVPKIGFCQENCNLCGEVCPTDAIEPFTPEEKKHIFIGTASIDRNRCIAWYSDKKCLVCDEHCSYKAIEWKVVDGVNRPFVNEKKCVGCGICEAKCPIQPSAAIRVYSIGDKRTMTREEQKSWSETK